MIIKNVKVYTEEKLFKQGNIYIQNGKFSDTAEDDVILDGKGAYAIPGLLDIHLHGCDGADVCDGTKEALARIAAYQVKRGVTAMIPATMTLPVEELEGILIVAAQYQKEEGSSSKGADLLGINMEGPFISRAKRGAQNEAHIIPCDTEICRRFLNISEGFVKFVGIAPEECGDAVSFIEQMKPYTKIALAHTNAGYEDARRAFEAGAGHVVHLYNGMSPFSHREPGVVGAAADCRHVYAELICDGIHVHPSAVRAAFSMIGEERLIFVSDSMRATGLEEGIYDLGGLPVLVKEKKATLVCDDSLAGSVTDLMDGLRCAVQKVGIPLEKAVACVTMNPAKAAGVYDMYGSVSPGKKADVVLLDQNLKIMMVIKDGKRIEI